MHLRGQILSLHALLIAVMVFFAFFATELSPSVHLIVLATITVTLGCKHSNFFYCLLAEDGRDLVYFNLAQPKNARPTPKDNYSSLCKGRVSIRARVRAAARRFQQTSRLQLRLGLLCMLALVCMLASV